MKNNTRWILIVSFIITQVIFIGVLSYVIFQFDNVRNHSSHIVKKNNTKSELIIAMLSSARERVVDLFAMVNSDDPFIQDDFFLDFNKQGALFARSRMALLEQELSDKERLILQEQGKLTGYSVPLQNKLIDFIQADNIEDAKALLNGEGVDAQNKVLEKLAELLQLQQQNSQAILGIIDRDYKSSRHLIFTWTGVALLIGAIIAFVVIRKTSQIEHRLFDEMENARATLTSISDVILRIDDDNIIVFANKKANEMFGMRVSRHKISDILPCLSSSNFYDKNNKETQLGRFQIDIKNEKLWIEIEQADIKNELGLVTGKVLVLHDLTKLVHTQQYLESANENLELRVSERTENLQEANLHLQESLTTLAETQTQLIHSEKMAALGALVAGISHEINTPIGVSVTSATSIEEQMNILEENFLAGQLTKSDFEAYVNHTRMGLEILIKNLGRASDLIKSFKQVAVDQSSDELREIDLQSYCDEIILSLHPKLKKTSIKVSNLIPEGLRIYTNPGAIYQIISNLIINSIVHAFDANPPIEHPELVLESLQRDDQLVIQYKDNGIGVDEYTLAKIFEPFFTTKRGQGGSGLGMNLVYNLVTTTLKGQIKAMSKENEGLHIIITIPVQKQAENSDV